MSPRDRMKLILNIWDEPKGILQYLNEKAAERKNMPNTDNMYDSV